MKNDVFVLPADLHQPRFLLLGLLAVCLNKRVFFLGHLTGKRWGKLGNSLRRIYFTWPFKMFCYYQSELNFKHDRIIPLENSVNTDSISSVRNEMDFKKKSVATLRVLFIGRETEKSNFGFFLSVAAYFWGSNVHFFAIGPKARDDNSINFYGEVTEEKSIAEIFENIDIVFYPGDVGLSLIHAFQYNTPCIIHSDFSKHYPEVTHFKEGENGLTFKRNILDDAIKKIEIVNGNRSLLTTMSNNLEKTKLQNSAKNMAKNFTDAIVL